ncbi:HlyU family transcriptional regulator [Neptunomonas sp.]|uniref:HlyU family transcriptional regulator n=1 Tax=Neptunomonas sp. TaxID=1971898 RepID=UPI00260019D8|nr:HlyU family transcriptional regulator [Neptunomonas sp.]
MGLLKSLLGIFTAESDPVTSPTTTSQEEYKGYLLSASPAAEGAQFRISGFIEKGEDKKHTFIRADVLPTSELCVKETFRKAKLMIDQQGDNIFN